MLESGASPPHNIAAAEAENLLVPKKSHTEPALLCAKVQWLISLLTLIDPHFNSEQNMLRVQTPDKGLSQPNRLYVDKQTCPLQISPSEVLIGSWA